MYQLVCDLCGKPITNYDPLSPLWKDKCVRYKIKRYHELKWVKIDCHPKCVDKLFGIEIKYPTPPCLEESKSDNKKEGS